jgi:hypothetical protein
VKPVDRLSELWQNGLGIFSPKAEPEYSTRVRQATVQVGKKVEHFRANIPLGDFGQPADLGPLAVYWPATSPAT